MTDARVTSLYVETAYLPQSSDITAQVSNVYVESLDGAFSADVQLTSLYREILVPNQSYSILNSLYVESALATSSDARLSGLYVDVLIPANIKTFTGWGIPL